jgi:hypothetical protein
VRGIVAYGYRWGEVILPALPVSQMQAFVRGVGPAYKLFSGLRRLPMLVSLGCHVIGVCQPHPDTGDPWTLRAGLLKRVLSQPKRPITGITRALQRFVRRWVRKHLTPLNSLSDVSFETWIAATGYPDWRKDELRKKWSLIHGDLFLSHKWFKIATFMKDETYGEYKHGRSINSRSDEFKCATGPIFHLIEKEVFALPWFIKKIPVLDRPDYILSLLYSEGCHYYPTDYSSFESLFTRELMNACEFELYDYMTSSLSDADRAMFMGLVREVLGGYNILTNKHLKAGVLGKRMSGEMCTSLGNGFSNLMFTKFVCWKHGIKDVVSVHEGDDGLIATHEDIRASWFEDLGLCIKLEKVDAIERAGFCQMYFDRFEKNIVTSPAKLISKFGWASGKYWNARPARMLDLLRCKSLSLMSQYPGCPILCALADYGMRVTRGRDVREFIEKDRNLDHYTRVWYRTLASAKPQRRDVGMRTRLLVEELYGFSVERQIQIEAYLDSLNDLRPLSIDIVDHVHPDCIDYWDRYVSCDFGDMPPQFDGDRRLAPEWLDN